MSYIKKKTGKQYVLLTVPGEATVSIGADHSDSGDESDEVGNGGGYVIAYALPE